MIRPSRTTTDEVVAVLTAWLPLMIVLVGAMADVDDGTAIELEANRTEVGEGAEEAGADVGVTAEVTVGADVAGLDAATLEEATTALDETTAGLEETAVGTTAALDEDTGGTADDEATGTPVDDDVVVLGGAAYRAANEATTAG